jgi:hypothetical protein
MLPPLGRALPGGGAPRAIAHTGSPAPRTRSRRPSEAGGRPRPARGRCSRGRRSCPPAPPARWPGPERASSSASAPAASQASARKGSASVPQPPREWTCRAATRFLPHPASPCFAGGPAPSMAPRRRARRACARAPGVLRHLMSGDMRVARRRGGRRPPRLAGRRRFGRCAHGRGGAAPPRCRCPGHGQEAGPRFRGPALRASPAVHRSASPWPPAAAPSPLPPSRPRHAWCPCGARSSLVVRVPLPTPPPSQAMVRWPPAGPPGAGRAAPRPLRTKHGPAASARRRGAGAGFGEAGSAPGQGGGRGHSAGRKSCSGQQIFLAYIIFATTPRRSRG